MRIIFIYLFLSAFTLSFAQKGSFSVPNFREIEADVKDFDSQFYYPSLTKKLAAVDTTMTTSELEHLYYGYIFQEDYDPYRDIKYHTKNIDTLYIKEKHTPAECDTIIKYAKSVLADFPFEFRQMKLMAYAYKNKGDEQKSELWTTLTRQFLNIILRTGDGLSPESAWYVISSIHEYDIIYWLGLIPSGYTFVEPMYDFIDVNGSSDKIDGYYFNVSQMLREYIRKQ
ncbi:MAG: DUF4919 domain-containing protein [Bacteroidales bacterium]